MIGYTMVGVSDLERASAFYDALFTRMGNQRLFTDEAAAYWGRSPSDVKFAITLPFDGRAASSGNGTMIAFKAKTRAEVDAVHALALTLGGKDEGAAGPRGEGNYYGGYFRDLDGNKLAIYTT